jgi:hypothetical protein
MAEMRQVDADLMFTSGARNDSQQRETSFGTQKFLFDPKFRLRCRAVGSHAIFDGDDAALVLPERRVNQAVIFVQMAVDDGQILFFNRAAFQNFSEFARDIGIFRDENDAAGFTVEAIHQMWLRGISQMQPRATDEAGPFAVFCRVTDETGWFVDDQQFVVLKNDFKKFFHNLFLRGTDVSFARVKEKCNQWLPLVFVALFAVSRIPGLLPLNFSAAYAFAFCAGVYFPKKNSWWLPVLILLATDIGLNFYYSSRGIEVWDSANLKNLFFNYIAYAVLIFLGRRFKPQSSFVSLLGGGILGAVLFYLITNTASWFFNPFHNVEYAKTFSGWLLALTKGINGYPSTWEFFRNTLLSGGIFTALFVAAAKLTAPAESPADKKAGARDEEPEAEEKPEEANA